MSTLETLLSSRVKAEVLRLLFGVEARELHVRELERQSGLSVSTVRQELKRFAGLGLVVARPDGNRTYYRAQTEHPLFPDLRNVVLKTTGLVDVLRTALEGPGIQLVFVFGSVAEENAKARSDVDLLVIGTIGLRKLSRRLAQAAAALGREIDPHVLSASEFARRRRARDHFLTMVLAGPRLFVIGDEDELTGL